MIKSIKQKVWIGAILLAVLAFASLFGVIRLEINVTTALWALAGFVLAYTAYVLISYWTTPRTQVTISTKVELTAPPRLLKSVKNYRLKVSSEKHIEEKGKERNVKMDELILTFNSSDHPDTYDFCLRVINKHINSCMESAQDAHPEALVTGAHLALPHELKQLED